MDLDETWQVELRPKKTQALHVSSEIALWVSGIAQKMSRGGVFCDVNDAPLLPLSLDRFPPNFPRVRVQVMARDTWFHISEKFPLRDRISGKLSSSTRSFH